MKSFVELIGSEWLEYSWTRVDGKMPLDAEFYDHNRLLKINNVQLSHEGTYRCHVRRQLGGETYGDVTIAIEGMSFSWLCIV